MRLNELETLPSFALLGPGWSRAGRALLLQGLEEVGASEGTPPRLFFAAYEDVAPAFYRASSEREVEVSRAYAAPALSPVLDLDGYGLQVAAIREAIAQGDVYQVNLTVRAELGEITGAELATLFCRSGAPRFFAWVRFPDGRELVSGSPECLFHVEGRRIRVEPMKGTAPLGEAERLLSNTKDDAELAMITDLLRHELAPLCRPRSVRVVSAKTLVELPYALQTVAQVEGDLMAPFEPARVLAALHPGGSVVGTPKPMARRFIERLEGTPRGAYCGTLGLCEEGRALASILIRTAERFGKGWRYGTGSAITWDSDPLVEAAELRLKLGALQS
jgi:anthranilate/para-aminobenzoate synthase component I